MAPRQVCGAGVSPASFTHHISGRRDTRTTIVRKLGDEPKVLPRGQGKLPRHRRSIRYDRYDSRPYHPAIHYRRYNPWKSHLSPNNIGHRTKEILRAAHARYYQRYQVDPDADFNDVVTSQQTLATTISTYIQLLGDQWQAVADLAGLLQSDDIFAMGQTQ